VDFSTAGHPSNYRTRVSAGDDYVRNRYPFIDDGLVLRVPELAWPEEVPHYANPRARPKPPSPWLNGSRLELANTKSGVPGEVSRHPPTIALFLLFCQFPCWLHGDLAPSLSALLQRGLGTTSISKYPNSLYTALDRVKRLAVLVERHEQNNKNRKMWIAIRKPSVSVARLGSDRLVHPDDARLLDRLLMDVVKPTLGTTQGS
jgi:hypothetical protein